MRASSMEPMDEYASRPHPTNIICAYPCYLWTPSEMALVPWFLRSDQYSDIPATLRNNRTNSFVTAGQLKRSTTRS